MLVRANTTFVDESIYRAKAERWCQTWPEVTVALFSVGVHRFVGIPRP
jgi:hypothetical protein